MSKEVENEELCNNSDIKGFALEAIKTNELIIKKLEDDIKSTIRLQEEARRNQDNLEKNVVILKESNKALKEKILISSERSYVVVNTSKLDYMGLIFWGDKLNGRSFDDEERIYNGYTTDIRKAELYTVEEFGKRHGVRIAKSIGEALSKFPDTGSVLIKLKDAEMHFATQK